MPLDEDIELMGLPQEGEIKVVQIMFDGHPVMICGSEKESYHAFLLEDFLTSKGINPQRTTSCMEKGRKIVAVEGERYKVVGMGRCVMFSDSKNFRLPYGGSADYQDYVKGTNQEFRERLQQQFSDWNFC